MTDATPSHVSTSLTLHRLEFDLETIRATRHPVHGRLLMAKDVVEAIGYKVKTYTGFTLNGLKVSEANRITLAREDFDTSGKKLVPTFSTATFLTRAGLDELVANAAAKKVKTFGPWVADVMENGVPKRKPKVERGPASEVPPEGPPWED